MLCWFLSHNNVNQMYMSPPPPHPQNPTLLGHQSTGQLPEFYSWFPLVIYFTHGKACVSVLLSQFVHSSHLPSTCTHCPFSTSVMLGSFLVFYPLVRTRFIMRDTHSTDREQSILKGERSRLLVLRENMSSS